MWEKALQAGMRAQRGGRQGAALPHKDQGCDGGKCIGQGRREPGLCPTGAAGVCQG